MADAPPPGWSFEEVSHQIEQELHTWSSSKKIDFEEWARRIKQALRANEADTLHPRGRLVATMYSLFVAKDKKVKQERLNALAGVLFYAHRMVYEQNRGLELELSDSRQQLQELKRKILGIQLEFDNPEIKGKNTRPKLKDVFLGGIPLNPNLTPGAKKFYVSTRYKGNRPQENYVYQSPVPSQTGLDHNSDEEGDHQPDDKKEGEEEPQEKGDSSTKQYEGAGEMESYSSANSYVFSQPREHSPERYDSVALDQRILEIEHQMLTMQEAMSQFVVEGKGVKASSSPAPKTASEKKQE